MSYSDRTIIADSVVWRGRRLKVEEIEARWGLPGDEGRVAELLELNGMPRWVAFEDRFIVAERDGELLAALGYRMETKKLLLGLLVADPWAGERMLARALYGGAYELAREIGAREVLACSMPYGDYPFEAGYRRSRGGWRLDATRARGELPKGGWRRVVTLLGIPAVPFFRVSRH